jgi:hypothetical protein
MLEHRCHSIRITRHRVAETAFRWLLTGQDGGREIVGGVRASGRGARAIDKQAHLIGEHFDFVCRVSKGGTARGGVLVERRKKIVSRQHALIQTRSVATTRVEQQFRLLGGRQRRHGSFELNRIL